MIRLFAFMLAIALPLYAQAGQFTLHVAGPLTASNAIDGFGCHGRNMVPAITWSDPPAGTRSFALTVFDPDAPGHGWWHWVAVDLPSTTRGISHGRLPPGARSFRNSYGRMGWGGPCPPTGPPHHYVFTLYALNVAALNVPADASPSEVAATIQAHVLGKAQQVWRYGR